MPGMRQVREPLQRRQRWSSEVWALLPVECALALIVLISALGPWGQPATDSAPASFVPAPTLSGDPAEPTAPAGPRRLTVLGAGDILIHPPVWEQARADADGEGFDFRPIFEALTGAVSGADLAICHLETPLAPADGPFLGWPRFSAPPQLLEALVAVGYDTCSTASNHTLDQGEAGVYRTIDALAGAGLDWAGSARDAREAADPTVLEVVTGDGRVVGVGQLSYTFGFNGLLRPAGKEWIANLIDLDQILADARAAREEGAEIVVVSLHWGEEYQVEPSASQLALAKELSASGEVDLVLGHHAHVVQPVERVEDTWVVFGMGNQVARHAEPIDAQREGVLVLVTFTEAGDGWAVSRIEAVPTWVELSPRIRLVDLPAALSRDDLTASQRTTYQDAYTRITDRLMRRDGGTDGLVVR